MAKKTISLILKDNNCGSQFIAPDYISNLVFNSDGSLSFNIRGNGLEYQGIIEFLQCISERSDILNLIGFDGLGRDISGKYKVINIEIDKISNIKMQKIPTSQL